jgi:hypothetical protein
MGLKKGDTVEIFFDESIYEEIGRPAGSNKNYGIVPIEYYENQYWTIAETSPSAYTLKGDPTLYAWPRWLLRKANPTPDWEV